MAEEFIYNIDPGSPGLPDVNTDSPVVAIACRERIAVGEQWMLEGLFQLPASDLAAIDQQPHRALVLVATLGGSWYTDSPLRQKIFFPDDLHQVGKLTRGYFSFELFSLFKDRVPGTYRLRVSLGEYISQSVLVEVS